MDSMLYPIFRLISDGRIIPNTHLPIDFREIVPIFYQQGKKEEIEEYAKTLEGILRGTNFEIELGLQWSDNEGLTHISVGIHGGFYLETSDGWPCFQEHNLGFINSYVAGSIAQQYVSELLKSKTNK